MKVVYKKIDELKPYEDNPRANQEAVKYVANSIKEFGFKVPIIIDKNDIIIAGHTRYKACQTLKIDEIPCVIADDLTDTQIKAFRLADNKVAEFSEWDFGMLEKELLDLQELDFDMSSLGFEELESNFDKYQEIEEDNFNVDENLKESTNTKVGDIFKLGNHFLMCGDSTKLSDIKKLVSHNKIDLIITDPPYGVDYSNKNEFLNKFDNGNRNQKSIINDNIEDYEGFFIKMFENIKFCCSEYNALYVFMSGEKLHNLRNAFEKTGGHWSDYLIWLKNNHVLGRKDYNNKIELCMYGWFGKHKFYGGFSTNVLEFNKPLKNDLHPTMKPIELLAKLIQDASLEKMKVLDLFGGSGSTLIACEQLNRCCYMMELDPCYVDIIITRWENLTGKKAEKIVSG